MIEILSLLLEDLRQLCEPSKCFNGFSLKFLLFTCPDFQLSNKQSSCFSWREAKEPQHFNDNQHRNQPYKTHSFLYKVLGENRLFNNINGLLWVRVGLGGVIDIHHENGFILLFFISTVSLAPLHMFSFKHYTVVNVSFNLMYWGYV